MSAQLDRWLRSMELRSQHRDAIAAWERTQPRENLPPCMHCGTTRVPRDWGRVVPSPDGNALLKLDPICATCDRDLLAVGLLGPGILYAHERKDIVCAP
jgi:hypothetical protein